MDTLYFIIFGVVFLLYVFKFNYALEMGALSRRLRQEYRVGQRFTLNDLVRQDFPEGKTKEMLLFLRERDIIEEDPHYVILEQEIMGTSMRRVGAVPFDPEKLSEYQFRLKKSLESRTVPAW